MKRLMIILTALWVVVTSVVVFLAHSLMNHPAGGDVLQAYSAVEALGVIFHWMCEVWLPLLVVGWFVTALRGHAKREKPTEFLQVHGRPQPGLYVRDEQSRTYKKLGPPC